MLSLGELHLIFWYSITKHIIQISGTENGPNNNAPERVAILVVQRTNKSMLYSTKYSETGVSYQACEIKFVQRSARSGPIACRERKRGKRPNSGKVNDVNKFIFP